MKVEWVWRAPWMCAIAVMWLPGVISAQDGAGADSTRGVAVERGGFYRSDDGHFRITFPDSSGSPTENSETVDTEIGPVEMHTAMTATESTVSMIAYSMFPEAAFEDGSGASILDRARDGALANLHATIDREDTIEVNGHVGKAIHFTGTGPNGRPIHGRIDMLMVRPYFYQIMYASENQEDIDAEPMQRFFDSFGLLDEVQE